MTSSAGSGELMEQLRALSNPARLEILQWLRQPESFPPQDHDPNEVGVCLKHIQSRAAVSQSTASQYMATLQRAGFVTSNRIGQWTHYRRDEGAIENFRRSLRDAL